MYKLSFLSVFIRNVWLFCTHFETFQLHVFKVADSLNIRLQIFIALQQIVQFTNCLVCCKARLMPNNDLLITQKWPLGHHDSFYGDGLRLWRHSLKANIGATTTTSTHKTIWISMLKKKKIFQTFDCPTFRNVISASRRVLEHSTAIFFSLFRHDA